jgi:hypothetical protein
MPRVAPGRPATPRSAIIFSLDRFSELGVDYKFLNLRGGETPFSTTQTNVFAV